MHELLKDWHNWLPLAGLAVLGVVGLYYALRRKPENPDEIERLRRAYLNRVGRIVEGHVLEVVDHDPVTGASDSLLSQKLVAREAEVTESGEGAKEAVGVAAAAPDAKAEAARKIGAAAKREPAEAADRKPAQSAVADRARERSSGAAAKSSGIFSRRPLASNASRKLLYYTYAISGVTYETAQDVTGLEARLHLASVAAGQTASVKYDPSNPSNSILLAEDWSGLH